MRVPPGPFICDRCQYRGLVREIIGSRNGSFGVLLSPSPEDRPLTRRVCMVIVLFAPGAIHEAAHLNDLGAKEHTCWTGLRYACSIWAHALSVGVLRLAATCLLAHGSDSAYPAEHPVRDVMENRHSAGNRKPYDETTIVGTNLD